MNISDVINESRDTITHVYFPTNCIISLLYVTLSGASTGISVVGREGLIGASVFMGGSAFTQAEVQSRGFAYRMDSSELKLEFEHHSEVRVLMLRYIQALITQMTQTAVCNRYHTVEKRLCRWLLLSLDRLQGNQLRMTHQLIANMLGVRREGVTDAANKLQNKGIIKYSRGQITVLDRRGLEALSCECYAAEKRETGRLAHFTAGM